VKNIFRIDMWIFSIVYNPNEHTLVMFIDHDVSIYTDFPIAWSPVLWLL
jgi:hypothetical protein